MDMRSSYVKQGAEIAYFIVKWNPANLDWEQFR